MPQSSEWSLSIWLSHQNLVHFYFLTHACHIPSLPYSPLFDLPYDIWWWVNIMKLPILQLFPLSCYFIQGPNICLSTLFSNTSSLFSSLNVRSQLSYPYKRTGRIIVFYILTFTFLDSSWEGKRLWTEW
jgi:hypothetical protein